MSDDLLPDAPMAVIPGANDGILDLLSPKSTLPEEHQPRGEQTSAFENFTDEQFHAMLAASYATPPPFETVNPSCLSSPGPATDFSGSGNSSPFRPVEYQIFNTKTSLSCPPTTDLAPLPAPTARRYSKHLSLHDGAYTEPHASPVGFPLNAQSPEPADEQPGMYFTLHRQLQERLMQDDDGTRNKHHQSQQAHTAVPAHNQAPHAGGPARYAPSPTLSPHPYLYAQQQEFQPHPEHHHHQQQQQQQQTNNPSLPPHAQITFHRQSGHFIGQPRPRRHPYPPAAPPQAPGADGTGYAQHPIPQQHGSNNTDNINLLNCAGTVRIGTPVAPPPGSSRSATPTPYHAHPHPHLHPPPATMTMMRATAASPTPSTRSAAADAADPAFSPASTSPTGPQRQRESSSGSGSGSNSNSSTMTTTTGRTRSNTAPTPSSPAARSRGRLAAYPYPSPAGAGPRSSSPFHPATTLPYHPHHHPLHYQQSIRGVERPTAAAVMMGHRRVGSGRSAAGTPGPTSAPMMMMSAAPRHGVLEHHLKHQRMWTPEPGGGGGGDAVSEVVSGGLRMAKRREQDTLVLGIQGIVERINRECDGLKEWVREAVEERGEGEQKGELERKRLEKRNKNFAVTKLDEPLEPLPRSMQLETGLEDVPWDVPPNAQEIRNLDHDAITPLLEAYGIPFQSEMFLGQKKELYLRFIGANRGLMHRVLD